MASQPGASDTPSTAETSVHLRSEPAPGRPSARLSSTERWHARVALIKGTGPELTGEIASLLRQRLRLAGVLMSVGFAGFLVRHAFYVCPAHTGSVPMFVAHVLVTAILGVVTYILWHGRQMPLPWVRLCELIVFGLPVAFFVAMQYFLAVEFAKFGDFEFETAPWLLLMFTYALFIPNPYRRAAVVISVIALAPILLMFTLLATSPEVAALMTSDRLTGLPLMLILAAVGSVMGVDTIGALRREAFEARQLGQYRLKQQIGAGGMGEVYLAEHQLLKRPCVVKLIQPSKAGDPSMLARFQREVQATAKLSHWNTVEIFDYGSTADGTFYYVMEYLPGMSLQELVERHGPLPPERVIYLLRQACDALREAHAAGLVHRDIKPGNIFAAQRGGVYDVAKLLDFGLVKPLLEERPVHLTAEGTIAGSPLFMSPEQALGQANPDGRSDIYSMGAVAYYALTGRPPFQHDTAMKILMAHVQEEVVPPSKYVPEIPADLERTVLRCMAKAPADRFQDAASLAAAFGECEAAAGWSRERAAQWWQEVEQAVCV